MVLQDRVETKPQQSNTGQHIQRKQAEKQEQKIHKVMKVKKKKKIQRKKFLCRFAGKENICMV